MNKKLPKKKGFLVDKITEDSFYENLLLGLPSVLKSSNLVSQIKLERYPPATLEAIRQWEHANSLLLPEDLRNFFLSSNGFSLTYKFQYDKSESEEISHVDAGIELNPLPQVDKITTNDTMYLTEGGIRVLAPYSKIYVLARIDESNCVVLAQFNYTKPPNIWLYYKMKYFYFLCENITTYFKMALAHLGAPGWQMSVLKANWPEWSEEMIQILAPGVLDKRQNDANKSELNVLNCKIFITEGFDSFGREEEKSKGVGSVSGKKTPRNNGKMKK